MAMDGNGGFGWVWMGLVDAEGTTGVSVKFADSETDEFGSILGASVETSGRKDTNDTKMI